MKVEALRVEVVRGLQERIEDASGVEDIWTSIWKSLTKRWSPSVARRCVSEAISVVERVIDDWWRDEDQSCQ